MGEVTSTFKINYAMVGLINSGDELIGLPNPDSPAEIQVFTIPDTGRGISTPKFSGAQGSQMAAIIIPPTGNTTQIFLKESGANPGNGIRLHKQNPSLLSLDELATEIFLHLTAGDSPIKVRIIWI